VLENIYKILTFEWEKDDSSICFFWGGEWWCCFICGDGGWGKYCVCVCAAKELVIFIVWMCVD
jgi:hypothetical protein